MRQRRIKPVERHVVEQRAKTILLCFTCIWITGTTCLVVYNIIHKRQFSKKSNHPVPFQPGMQQISPIQQQSLLTNNIQKSTTVQAHNAYESPLLIFTCKRPEYLHKTLDYVLQYIPHDCSIGCPVIVSQDGKDAEVGNVIDEFKQKFASLDIPLVHAEHPSALRGGRNAYQALAVHYGWALKKLFQGDFDNEIMSSGSIKRSAKRVIILEEDIQVANDFFGYFAAMASLLDNDRSLLAVSAFNDNSLQGNVKDVNRVLRSDFFPGLGWMMSRRLWDFELSHKWPDGYWDDWLREPAQRQNRHIIRPEVSRTFHFGFKGGASKNQFGDQLSHNRINTVDVSWDNYDVSQLSQDKFDSNYLQLINDSQVATSIQEAMDLVENGNTRLEYKDFDQFQRFAHRVHLMTDEKAGIPRTAYKGVVETRLYGEHILFLTPEMSQLTAALTLAVE